MISDFAKEQQARRIAASQFTEGSFVAIVNTHWNRRIAGKRQVVKVHANGNFTITGHDGKPSPQQYRPSLDGKYARAAGKQSGFRTSEHLEPWTPAIEQEIAERKEAARNVARQNAIIERLKTGAGLSDETLTTLEQTLGLTQPATTETDDGQD